MKNTGIGRYKWVIQMCTKKIVAFTGTRSDYDLLSGLYTELNNDENFEIKLIVSGSHLSEKQGNTLSEILKDEIPILAKIESLIESNNPSGRVKSLSILLQNAIHTIADYSPDLIIISGDREEVPVGALIGAYLNIPVAHFFGGDHATDGHVDNPIRHAASKLANIHFTTNQISSERLLKIGESRERIFNVGSPSLDKFNKTVEMSKLEIMEYFQLDDIRSFALVIFHPMVGEEEQAGNQFKQIISVLKDRKIPAFISYPNVDSGSLEIINVIEENKNEKNFYFFKNLPRDIFINIFRQCDFLIGNSSAGIYEAPLLKKPVINVGKRQKGRYTSENVLFVENDKLDITNAIDKIYTKDFKNFLLKVESIHGDGYSVNKIMSVLKEIEYKSFLYKTEDPLGDI